MKSDSGTGKWIVLAAGVIGLALVLMLFKPGKSGDEKSLSHSVEITAPVAETPKSKPVAEPAPTPTTPAVSEAPAIASGNIGGRVTRLESKAPIPGVDFSLFRVRGRVPSPFDDTHTESESDPARSDEDGVFRFPASVKVSPEAMITTFTFESPDAPSGYVQLSNPTSFLAGSLHLELAEFATLGGEVVDSEDKPIAGAKVAAFARTPLKGDASPAYAASSLVYRQRTTSDANGTFAISNAASGQEYVILAKAPGYAVGGIDKIASDTKGYRVVLEKAGAKVLGLVLNADRTPAANISISANRRNRPGSPPNPMIRHYSNSTKSDESGRFEFTELTSDSWGLYAYNPDAPNAGQIHTSVVVPESGEITVEMVFAPPVTVNVTVLEDETDRPMAGVPLSGTSFDKSNHSPEAFSKREVVYTDANGKATLKIPTSGEGDYRWLQCYIEPMAGWTVVSPYTHQGAFQGHNLADKTEIEQVVKLKQGLVATLQIFDVDGTTPTSLAFAQVARKVPPQHMSIRTDTAGRASITVSNSATYTISMEANSGWLRDVFETPAALTPAVIPFTLKPFTSIRGKVVDEAGNPVEGSVVSYVRPEAGQANVVQSHSWFNATKSEPSSADGSFEIPRIAGSHVALMANPPVGSSMLAGEVTTVEILPGTERADVVLTIGEGATIVATIKDEKGNLLSDVKAKWSISTGGLNHVYIMDGVRVGHTEGSGISDAEGRIVIGGVSETNTVQGFTIEHTGYQKFTRNDIKALEGDFTVVLQPAASLTLSVVDESTGRPVTHFDYILYQSAWDQWSIRGSSVRVKDPDGITPLTVEGSGGKRIGVIELDEEGKATGRKGAATFTVPEPGESRQVIVPIGATASIRGVVMTEGSKDIVAGALVRQKIPAYSGASNIPAAFRIPEVTTDEKGRFELTGLVEGTYELEASKDGNASIQAATVEIGDDHKDQNDVEIFLSRLGTLTGKCKDADGKPITNGRLYTYSQTQQTQLDVRTDKDGNYRFENLAPGGYSVTLIQERVENSGSMTLSTEIKIGEDSVLDFDYSTTIEIVGTITMNGKPWSPNTGSGNNVYFHLNRTGRGTASLLPNGTTGYTTRLQPGTWSLVGMADGQSMGRIRSIEVADEPMKQEHNITFQTTQMNVALVMPEGVDPLPGNLTLAVKNGETVTDNVGWAQISGERKHYSHIVPGNYRVSYQSRAENYTAESEWQEITIDGENVVILFPKKDTSKLNALGRVQQQLKNLGYDPGPVDGLMGPMTGNAIRKFQGDEALTITGQPDEPTKARLDKKAPL